MILRCSNLFLLLLFAFGTAAQGIEFFRGSWQDALKEARKQDKIIFVDAYAEWCGPCKRMARQVFPNPEVGRFYNQHFINVKMDMEKGEGPAFGKKYPVSAYPTLMYIDYTGEMVQQVRGARQVEGLIRLGKKALSKIDRSGQYAEKYEQGDRDPELIYNYVKALNQAGKPSLKIANHYLDTQEDLTSDFNLRFILEATTECDSRIFDLLIEHRSAIEALTSGEQVESAIYTACLNTAQKAAEYRTEMLLDEAVADMKAHHPKAAKSFERQMRMDYYRELGPPEAYTDAAKTYAKKEIGKDPAGLAELAREVRRAFPDAESAQELAEDLARKAAKKGKKAPYYLRYAKELLANGKKEEARKAAEKALKLAAPDKEAMMRVQFFLRRLG